MFDKLEDLRIRLDEILNELQEPDVANDQNLAPLARAVCIIWFMRLLITLLMRLSQVTAPRSTYLYSRITLSAL